MSFTPIENAEKSNLELDALMRDVQRLLHTHMVLKTENEQLKLQVFQQDQLMKAAHQRLIAMLKRMPNDVADPLK